MGRRYGFDAFIKKVLQYGNRQCSAFQRIGSGSQLVQKHQGILAGILYDVYDVGHV